MITKYDKTELEQIKKDVKRLKNTHEAASWWWERAAKVLLAELEEVTKELEEAYDYIDDAGIN